MRQGQGGRGRGLVSICLSRALLFCLCFLTMNIKALRKIKTFNITPFMSYPFIEKKDGLEWGVFRYSDRLQRHY